MPISSKIWGREVGDDQQFMLVFALLLQRTSDMQKNVNKLIDLVVAVAYQFLGVCTIPIGYCNNYIHCE